MAAVGQSRQWVMENGRALRYGMDVARVTDLRQDTNGAGLQLILGLRLGISTGLLGMWVSVAAVDWVQVWSSAPGE